MEVLPDAELAAAIVSAGASARAAERELCRRFSPRVRLYGLKHLGDEERARDLAQAVLLAVLEALRGGRVEDLARVDRFVLGTARHLASGERRVRARAELRDPADLDVLGDEPVTDHVDVGALQRCLQALEERARTILHLSYHRDHSAEEIGAALAITPGNVRVLRHRAMGQLRACLDGPRPAGGAA